MTVRVLAFGRVREALGFGERQLECDGGATAGCVWDRFAAQHPVLEALAPCTRLARNGSLVERGAELRDGDEVAFLPPVGGG
jgi:molybdopterin synthase sulfur carrier subunit